MCLHMFTCKTTDDHMPRSACGGQRATLFKVVSVLFFVALARQTGSQPCCNSPASAPTLPWRCLDGRCVATPASHKFFDVKIGSWLHGKDVHLLSHLQTSSYFVSPTFLFLFFQNSDVTNVRSFLVSWAPGPPVSTSFCVSLCCPKSFALIILFPDL